MAMSLLDLMVNVKVSGQGVAAGELAGISAQAAKTDKAVGSSLRSIGSSMSRVGRGMSLFVTAPIALAGAAAIKMGAQFDQALTNAVSVTGKTGAAADKAKQQMNDLALTLGAKTAFSAKDAADAMYDLASSGWSVNDMQKGLNGIMAVAAATQTDLKTATEDVTSVIGQFGLKASDSGHVADVFTESINQSKATMDKLSESLKYAGPVAHALGIPLEETTAILSKMYDDGIEASTAGTALRMSLSRLINPTDTVKGNLQQVGVTMDDVSPKTHTISEIIETMSDAAGSAADRAKLFSQVFGLEAAPAMLTLADNTGKGKNSIDALTTSLKNSAGVAERTAKMQLNTLAGAWENLSGSLETAAIRFEQQIEPALKGILTALVPVVNWMSRLPAPIKAVIIGVAAFAAALGPLLVVLGLVLQAVGAVSLAFAGTELTLAGLAIAAAPVLAAIVGLAAAGIVLYKNWNRVAPVFQRVGQAVSGFLAPVRNLYSVIKAFVTGNWTGKTSKQFNSLSPALQKTAIVISGVVRAINAGLVVALKFAQKQAQVLINWWRANLPLIQTVSSEVFEGIRKLVGQSLLGLFKLVKGIIGGLIVFWRINHKELTAIAKAAWDVIKTIVRTAIHIVLDVIKLAMQLLTGDWKGAWTTIKDILKTLWDAMVRLVKDSLKIFANIIKAGWNTVKALTGQAWKDIKTMLSNAWDAIKSAASSAWQAISEAIYSPIEDAYNKIVDFVNKIITVVNSVLKAFGKDPITLVSHGGGPSTPNPGQDRTNLQLGRHGSNARAIGAFHRGGVMVQPNTGGMSDGRVPYAVYGEGSPGQGPQKESYLVHGKRSNMPYAQAWADSVGMTLVPKRASAAGGPHAGIGPRYFGYGGPHTWYPKTSKVNQYVEGEYGVTGSTYLGHGADGDAMNSVDWMTGQGWGVAAVGKFLEKGNQILDYLLDVQKTFTDYIIWQGKIYDSGGVGPYVGGGGYARPNPSDNSAMHRDHVHWESLENNAGPHVMGGPGAGTGPSLAELIWQKLSGVLPDVPSFGKGVVASAASSYLNNYKDWIHSWLLSKFGGGAPGGKSPGGLTIGQALSKGGWPSSELEHASAIVWRESGGDAHAQNRSGARGLMQIMPQTAKGIGYDYNRLYDPVYNTSGGHKLWSQQGYSPWVTEVGWQSSTGHQNDPVTGYDYGGLIKRDHLAKVHANELYLPLNNEHVERTAQTALGTSELRHEIAELKKALTDGGIKVKDYGHEATEVIVAGAHHGGLRAMKSKEGKAQIIQSVKEKNIKRELSGLRQGGW